MTHDEITHATPSEVMNEYIEQKKMYHFEGDSGIRRLNELTKAMGYDEHGCKYGSNLEVFLSDNPGAQQALISWIEENMCIDWSDNLSGELKAEEEVIEGIEAEEDF